MANTSHPGWNDLNIETVVQTSVSKGSVFKAVIDGQGNPELFYINAGSTDLVSEHLVISDFRATWYTINGFMRSDANLRVNVLLINDRDRSATYEFWGCYDPSHSTSVAEELMKIRNSIRITKVK